MNYQGTMNGNWKLERLYPFLFRCVRLREFTVLIKHASFDRSNSANNYTTLRKRNPQLAVLKFGVS